MSHPSESELLRLAKGELDDPRFEEVAAHLENCEQCGEFLRKPGAFPKLLAAMKLPKSGSPSEKLPARSSVYTNCCSSWAKAAAEFRRPGIATDAGVFES